MKIAVLGGGNGSFAAAGDLSLQGHEVRLWRRDTVAVAAHRAVESRIVVRDANGRHEAQLALVTTDIREAVRDAENVSRKIIPVVRIRNLGDSSIEWEVKYWLEDYAKHHDTDALIRQLVWYALGRTGLNFAFPTRTIRIERKPTSAALGKGQEVIDRLLAVEVFAPLSSEETEPDG